MRRLHPIPILYLRDSKNFTSLSSCEVRNYHQCGFIDCSKGGGYGERAVYFRIRLEEGAEELNVHGYLDKEGFVRI
jgi:hypothetical protein